MEKRGGKKNARGRQINHHKLFLFASLFSTRKKKQANMQRMSLRVNAAAKKAAAPTKGTKAVKGKTAPKSAGAAKPSLAKYYGEGRAGN